MQTSHISGKIVMISKDIVLFQQYPGGGTSIISIEKMPKDIKIGDEVTVTVGPTVSKVEKVTK